MKIGDGVKVRCDFIKQNTVEGTVIDMKTWETFDSNIEHTIDSFIKRYKIERLD